MKDLVIRQLTAQDAEYFPEGIELLNRTQGRDLFAKDYLEIRTADPKSYVVAAFQGGQIVSLGIAQIIDNYDFYIPFVPDINEQFKGKTVGSFSTLCTHESLQGKGVGKKLSQKRLEWLTSKNCDVIVGVSWVSGLKHTSDRVFEKMGFTKVKLVERFFEKMSTENPFECPGCYKQPCTCSAILYKKVL